MRNNVIIVLLLLIMAGCNNEENTPANEEEKNNLDWKIDNEVEQADSTNLGDELSIENLRINDSSEKVLKTLGDPISQDELRKMEPSTFKEIVYEQQYFLIKDNNVVGYATNDPSLKTKSGITVNDSLNKLNEVYSDYEVLKTDNIYYIYDEDYILTFNTQGDVINQVGLFELEPYLTMSDWTIEDLLLKSEPFKVETTSDENESSTEKVEDKEQVNKQLNEVDGAVEDDDTTSSDSNERSEEEESDSSEAGETEKKVFDTYEKIEQLAEFTRSIQIGDDESIIRDFVGEGEVHGDDGEFTTYGPFPAQFITQDGKLKLVSWGRVKLYDSLSEHWKNDEGVHTYSTYEQVSEAYAEYEHKILYKQGEKYPDYIIVDYQDHLLVFTFHDGIIMTVYRCSPEMLEMDMIKNTSFTFDRLEEEPF